MAGELLKFQEVMADGTTRVWMVQNAAGTRVLGKVAWHSPWRRYTFQPMPQTVFDAECLTTITTFLRIQTDDQKKTWRKPPARR